MGHHHSGDMDMGSSTMDPSMTNGSSHMPMMKMYFHFSDSEMILFQSWTISTVGGLIGSMIGLFLLAVLYEGLKFFRDYLLFRYRKLPNDKSMMCSWPHYVQTLLHIVQIGLAYVLMLVIMTYNLWLFFAVIFGSGVGYFLFGFWKHANSAVDITEHCM